MRGIRYSKPSFLNLSSVAVLADWSSVSMPASKLELPIGGYLIEPAEEIALLELTLERLEEMLSKMRNAKIEATFPVYIFNL